MKKITFLFLFVANFVFAQNFTEHIVDATTDGVSTTVIVDVDADGDQDLVSVSINDNELAWYENDGSENFTKHSVSTTIGGAIHVIAGDATGDGHAEFLVSAFHDDDIIIFFNDGSENFTPNTVEGMFDGANFSDVSDFDGDNDIDIVSVAYYGDELAWFENDGAFNFTKNTIATINGLASAAATDMDGDGKEDLLVTALDANTVVWYQNDGAGTFTEHIVDTAFGGAAMAEAVDLDNDGDLDILASGSTANEVAWYENDGTQNFTKIVIDATVGYASFATAADLNNDGNLDIVVSANTDNELLWFENDGAQNFTEHTVSTTTDGPFGLFVEDMDDDGDMDIALASNNDDNLIWFENDLIHPPTCGDQYVDSGGVDGNYSADENIVTTYTPNVSGEAITATFTYVDIESSPGAGAQDGCWDFLTIYNGPDTSYPVLAQTLCGEESGDGGVPSVASSLLSVGMSFTSTDISGALTFEFTSDPSIQETGWVADVTCAPLPVCGAPTNMAGANITQTAVDLTWTAGLNAETMWELVYDVDPYTQPGNGDATGEPNYLHLGPGATPDTMLTGLTANTTYNLYYRAHCGGSDYSAWTAFTFTTLADVIDLGCGAENLGDDFSNGISNTSALARVVAADIIVPINMDMTVSKIFINEFMGPDLTATDVTVTFYEDNAGVPGAVVATETVAPTSSTVVGSNFGFDISKLELDLAAVMLTGDAAAAVTYWIGTSVTTSDASNCFWENTDANVVGLYQAYDDGTGAGFTTNPDVDGDGSPDNREVVYAFVGACDAHVSGIADNIVDGFVMYPNPVVNELNVNADTNINEITIYNMLGQQVLKVMPNATQTQINTNKLATGTYILKVQAGEQLGSYNFIKQ